MSGLSKAEGGLPLGRATSAHSLMEVLDAKSHLDQPGRGTPMRVRNPDFIGCGSVDVAGIKHAPVQDERTRASYIFLPDGFKNQMLQMAMVSGLADG